MINSDKITFTIAANDQITDAEKYNDVVLAYRNGAPIRVRDVGQAVSEQVDRTVAAYQNNRDGVILAVFKQPGANVIDTVDQVKAELPQLTARIPPAVKVETILDRTVTIRASVEDVEFTLLLTICLVVMVILLFLRNFWATLIPSVTVPLALAGSFAAMYLMHFSLDNLSLMALTIAVGFVVDDAIVVVENIYRHVEHGEPPFTAALQRLARDRLHGAVDLLLAGRGVHSALVNERHHRPAVPRIRADRHRLDRGFGAGVADFGADDVLALHEARARDPRPRLSGDRVQASPPCSISTGARSTSCSATSRSRSACSSPPWRSP